MSAALAGSSFAAKDFGTYMADLYRGSVRAEQLSDLLAALHPCKFAALGCAIVGW
jgi:hypothetical protein